MIKKIITIFMATIIIIACGGNIVAADYDLPVPQTRKSDVYRYMDYTKITVKSSDQYKLQQNKYVSTDSETGIRVFEYNDEKFYLCAMTSTYGTRIGNCYEVTLENGTVFNVMLGDCKADYNDPNRLGDYCSNIDGDSAINVIEFIVDTPKVDDKVRLWGSFAALDQFNSDIKEIKYTKRLKNVECE